MPEHAGLTQEQLAEQVGISRRHMGAIEASNLCRPIPMDLLFNIATVLGIEPYSYSNSENHKIRSGFVYAKPERILGLKSASGYLMRGDTS